MIKAFLSEIVPPHKCEFKGIIVRSEIEIYNRMNTSVNLTDVSDCKANIGKSNHTTNKTYIHGKNLKLFPTV